MTRSMGLLRGAADNGLTAISEAEEVSDLPLATGDLPEELPIDIVAIEVRVAVDASTETNSLPPRDEAHRPLGSMYLSLCSEKRVLM